MIANLFRSYWAVVKAHGRLVTTAFLLDFFSVFGQTVFIGVYMPELRERFDLTRGGIGTFYGIATLLSAAALVWTGKGLDYIPLRRFITYILCGLTMGAILLVHAPYAWLLLPAFFLLRQFGQGLMDLTGQTAINRYIDNGRGRAMSIMNFGAPLHIFTMPLFAHWMNNQVGWENAWLSYAGFMLVGLIPLFLALLANHERDRHEPWLARVRAEDRLQETADEQQPALLHWARIQVLKDWRFYIICAVLIIPGTFNTAIFLYQSEIAAHLGLSAMAFATTFSLLTILMVSANIIGGYLLDIYGEPPLLFVFPPIYMAALLLLATGSGYGAAAAAMGLIGISQGLAGVVGGPLLARMYGTRHLGSIKATLIATMIFGTSAAPPLVGILLDFGVGIPPILFGFTGYAIITWLCWFLAYRALPAHRQQDTING